jgi:hypothetical protein
MTAVAVHGAGIEQDDLEFAGAFDPEAYVIPLK